MRIAHLLFALVLTMPGATAGTLALASADDVHLAGDVSVAVSDAQGRIRGSATSGAFELRGLDGVVRVHTWRQVALGDATVVQSLESPRTEELRVRNASLLGALQASPLEAEIVLEAGTATLRGPIDASGSPYWLPAPSQAKLGADAIGVAPEGVEWRWQEGWAFVGDLATTRGHPAPSPATLDLAGRGALQLDAGRVLIDDGAGPRVFDLGLIAREGPPGAAVETRARLVFHGAIASAEFPLDAGYGFAGPHARWRVDGSASWPTATGEYRDGADRRAFTSEPVQAHGSFTLAATRPEAAQSIVSYEGDGRFEAFVVSGADLALPPPTRGTPSPAWGLLLLLALAPFLPRMGAFVLAPLYSRLASADILRHPVRARLRDEVVSGPGIHLRDLHRRTGGAWGPFIFHLRLLVRTGHVVTRREGQYVAVYPAGAPLPVPQPHGETQRAILAALPADGGYVRLAALGASLGMSRQLVNHHVKQLATVGVLDRARDGREVLVRRAGAPANEVNGAHPNALGRRSA